MENKIEMEKEKIMSIFGEINQEIDKYYATYRNKPVMIVISKPLSMGMQHLMSAQLKTCYGYGETIYKLFGINCIESPKLDTYEYKVYQIKENK